MACVDFPTLEEQKLLFEMHKQNVRSENERRASVARIAMIQRLQQDIKGEFTSEEIKVLETMKVSTEEALFQGRIILMQGSHRYKTADESGKGDLMRNQIQSTAKVLEPLHPLIWKTRISMIQETIRLYQSTDKGGAKLRSLAQNGPKLREPGDWKSSTFPKEGGVKELPKNKALGNHAENLAAAHLDKIKPGLSIVGVIENSSGQGIDMIARDSQTGRLVAVEIKGQDMTSKAKAPHQMLKMTKEHGKQGSGEWLRHHIIGMAMTKAADMATSRQEGSRLDLMSRADEAMSLEKELLTQKGGLDTYVIAAQAKGNGMMTRISHRKGGEAEFKEITAKPQYVTLDAVVPPKVEEYDVNKIGDFQRAIAHQQSVDGNGTPVNSDERM